MKKRKGFTLVELLAVIVLLGILMAIAIPSALQLSKKVKEKAYNTKIDLIEAAAQNYGQSNLGLVRQGKNPANNQNFTCTFSFNGDAINSVNYARKTSGYSESLHLGTNEYWCMRVTVADLIGSNNLDYDEKNVCDERCSDADKANYDNIVVNPVSDYIVNQCYVYVYYKYNRVYATFDKKTCDAKSETYAVGHEYRRKA